MKPLAALTGVAVLATSLVAAAPATAAGPTTGLPGTGELSALATARPATVEQAEQQFTDRTPERFRDQGLAWAACLPEFFTEAERPFAVQAGLECAPVTVPRDWNSPDDGAEVTVVISRVPQAGPRPERSLLSNPGGPGGAGLAMPAAYGRFPGLAGSEFIGIDVRGTGASTSLHCADGMLTAFATLPDTRDRSAAALEAAEAQLSAVAAECAADPLAEFVTTEQTVADLDLVRHLLGRETVDYYGVSGGTWLGAQYATYFPARVGRFVLDSALDVTTSMQEAFGWQPFAYERRFEVDFGAYAAQYDWLFHLGSTPEEVVATYAQLRNDLEARPVEVPLQGTVDGFTLDSLITAAMYNSSGFENLAWTMLYLRAAHAAAVVGDLVGLDLAARRAGEQMELVPDPFTSSSVSTFYAITCNDTQWSQGAEFWNARGDELGPRYPIRGWQATWQPCGYWDRPDLTLPEPDGRDLPPVLVLQSLTDAATAYEGGAQTAKALPGTFVTVEGGDHGVYGTDNPCVNDLVTTFLADGSLPASDLTCPAAPVPAPGSQLITALGG
ncbi:alpha/beta hydrolase [Kineococcus sp. SYSU DK003]|uniref:alpha/beta hydrolase n=1 Tax=Kineococcus sp. SYSU DK003 TaxID=3383124 RepID=UPI003D7DD186